MQPWIATAIEAAFPIAIPAANVAAKAQNDCPERDPKCDEYEKNVRNAKDNIGDKYRGGIAVCQPAMSRGQLAERAPDWLRLAQARAQRDQKCFGGGDMRHQTEQATAWKQVSQCQNMMK